MTHSLTLNKVAAALVGVAMVAGVAFAFTATRAHAVTLSELVELFIALEVIPADKADEARTVLSGQGAETPATPVATMSCNFTRNLTVGATGADVMDLQKLLNLKGYQVAMAGAGSPGMESSYFGPATKGAVKKMQEAFAAEILTPLGLSTGTGYFGASTRAKANALCAEAPVVVPPVAGDDDDTVGDDDDDDDDTLSGGEATLGTLKKTNSPSNVDVAEGDEEVKVAGFEFDVEDGDVAIKRVYVNFEETSAAANSVKPWDYIDSVQLMLGDEVIAELDASSKSDWEDLTGAPYQLRFTDLNEKVAMDDTAKLYVAVTMVGNIDTADEDAEWTVSIPANGIRVVDGAGLDTTTDVAVSRIFNLEGAGQGEKLKATLATSNPKASVIKVDDTSATNDVTVLVFELKAEENDVEITTLPILFTSSDSDVATVLADAVLDVDGSSLGDVDTNGVGTTTTFEFDSGDFVIPADTKVTVKVIVDLNKLNNNYAEGTTLQAQLTVAGVDAEGAEIITTTGTAIGKTHQLLTTGIFAEEVSNSATEAFTDTANADEAKYKIKFDVTAFEDDFYIPFGATTTLGVAVRAGALYLVETDAGAQATTTGVLTPGLANTSGADTDSSHWIVRDGETETFELSVTYGPTANGTYRSALTGLYYATSTTAALQFHTAAPAEDFETGTVTVTDN